MIIEVKVNTWYRLLDKDAYFENDKENKEIYNTLFNIHGCVKSDTVKWGSLLTKSYLENPSDSAAYEIIAPNEYHLFAEVYDEYGNSTEQAEASESDSKMLKEDIDTITLTGEKGSVYKSRGTPDDIIKGANTGLGCPVNKPVRKEVGYIKDMFDEGIFPEIGMNIYYQELDKLISVLVTGFRMNRHSGKVILLTENASGDQINLYFEDICFPQEKTFEQKVVDKIKPFWENTFGDFDEHTVLDIYQTFKNIEKVIKGE